MERTHQYCSLHWRRPVERCGSFHSSAETNQRHLFTLHPSHFLFKHPLCCKKGKESVLCEWHLSNEHSSWYWNWEYSHFSLLAFEHRHNSIHQHLWFDSREYEIASKPQECVVVACLLFFKESVADCESDEELWGIVFHIVFLKNRVKLIPSTKAELLKEGELRLYSSHQSDVIVFRGNES